MASINTIVQITITKGTKSVSQESFSVPCIFGSSARFVDVIRYYSSTSAMLADGFLISDPEFIAASELAEQSPSVSQWAVSHFTPSVAQVDQFQVNLLSTGHLYSLTTNGVVLSYTASGGDTQQSILGQLLTQALAISPAVVSGTVVGTGAGATLTLTSSTPGVAVAYTAIDPDLTHVASVANHSIPSDIAVTQQSDNSWYGIIVCSHTDWDILQVAAYVETQLKLYGTSSNDAAILTSSVTDLASQLKAKNYTRTFLLYSASPAAFPEAAWIGALFPTTPGAANWNFKTLAGITADNLSSTQITFAQNKNCNVYIVIGGVSIATIGITPSGQYIDVTVFIDWLTSTMQSNVYSVLVNSAKVPYTNKGIVSIENPIAQTLQQGQNNGGLAPGWSIGAPDVSAVSSADKANRVLNGVTFQCTLAGAVNKVNVQGFVSV